MEAAPIEIGYVLSMHYRVIFLGGSVALGAVGAVGLGCSNKGGLPDDDAGTEGGAGDENTVDTGKPDGNTDGGVKTPCPSYPIKGECDPVAQNCAGGKECSVVVVDGGPVTACADPKSGSVPKGGKCSATADCVAGTECIPLPPNGRCTPACCPGSDQACGNSVPEGYIGICAIDVQYVQNNPNAATGRVCNYAADCKPFRIQDCPGGTTTQACQVEDMSGSAKCSDIYQPPGKAVGVACMYKNDCADGMLCIGPQGMAKCMWACYKGGGPFDAGIAQQPAGKGGCPATKSCSTNIMGLPTWYGVCSL